MFFKHWTSKLTTEETNELLFTLSRKHLQEVVLLSREREQLRHLVDSGDLLGVCDFDLSPPRLESEYGLTTGNLTFANDLYHLSQVLAFFKKRQDLDLGVDRAQAAWEKFEAAERSCKLTNDTFQAWSQGRFQFRPCVEAVLHGAQRKILRVLGPCPSVEDLRGRFGPGATTQVAKSEACAKVKLSQALASSGDMVPLLERALETLPHFYEFDLESEVVTVPVEIHCGKLVAVPKTWKTDRMVMVEPWLNSFFQLGVGDLLTKRLLRAGIDITDQEKNKSLARVGSLTGALATLDLSSASDTLSAGLVQHLLPTDWYDLLSMLRTSECCMKGGFPFRLQKFSSMGNGFTFPLETLVFWALVSSIVGSTRDVSVYGDDIICPSTDFSTVERILGELGFEVNSEKSFSTGYFRESCGGDYYYGMNVRPVFVKDRVSCADVFRLHNFYRRNWREECADYLFSLVPESLRLTGPDGYGDGHLIVRNDDWGYISRKSRRSNWFGRSFDTYTFKKRLMKRLLPGDRILPVYSIYIGKPFETKHTPEGIPVDFIPGAHGYQRISIYTLG